VAIRFSCECQQQFESDDDHAGLPLRCPKCRRDIRIPSAGTIGAVIAPRDRVYLSSGRALASLILGLLSLVAAAFTGLPAIVLGCRALSDIKKSRGWMTGRSLALAGIALGAFGSTAGTFVMIVPVYRSVREVQRRAVCSEKLQQVAQAMHKFHDANGTFPPAAITDKTGKPLLSWRVAILPHLGPDGLALFRQFHLNEPWDSRHNRPLLDKMPALYACPDEPRSTAGMTDYVVTVGPGTLFTGSPKGTRIADVIAGTSNTIMITESSQAVPWTAPHEIVAGSSENGPQAGSRHPSGHHIVMADGSVRFMPGP
jgi:prepilin-type processing-associated H-X9-DG protein